MAKAVKKKRKLGKVKLKKIRAQLLKLMKHQSFINARITRKYDRIPAGTYGYVPEAEYIRGRRYYLFENPMVQIPGYQIGIYVPEGCVAKFKTIRISDHIDKINARIDKMGGE